MPTAEKCKQSSSQFICMDMLSKNKPITSESSLANSTERYRGRSELILAESPVRTDTLKRLRDTVIAVEPLAHGKEEWAEVKTLLQTISGIVSNPDRCIPRYKLEILSEAICPYIKTMKGRNILSGERFPQIIQILQILDISDEQVYGYLREGQVHPSFILMRLEGITRAIDSTPSWFRSELSTKLKHATDKQWQPILIPLRYK